MVSPHPQAEPPRSNPRRWRLSVRWICAVALLLVFGLACYACASIRQLEREIVRTPRDPRTGVIRGAEAIDLHPRGTENRPTTACLMLHGYMGCRKDFGDLGARLAQEGLNVRMVRLPGHGTTPGLLAAQSADILLRAAGEELAALRAHHEAVYVVGFSMGGTLGTLLAAHEGVDRLVLAAPYYRVAHKWYYGLRPETWNRLLRLFVPFVARSEHFVKVNRPAGRDQILAYDVMSTRAASWLMELGAEARRTGVPEAIRCPVLMIMSRGDEAACASAAQAVFRRLGSTDKRLHWLPARNNHHLFWDWDREEAKAQTVAFLTTD